MLYCVVGWVVPGIMKDCSACIFRIRPSKKICHLTSMPKPIWSFDTSGTIHPVTHCHIAGNLNIQTSVCLSRLRMSIPCSNTDLYICLNPFVPLFFRPSISLVAQILFRSPVIYCISLLLAFIQTITLRGPCGHFCLSVVQNELFVSWKFKWKFSGLLYKCIVILCGFNTFSRWLYLHMMPCSLAARYLMAAGSTEIFMWDLRFLWQCSWRSESSGMWQCVIGWIVPDISKEHSACILRLKVLWVYGPSQAALQWHCVTYQKIWVFRFHIYQVF